MLISRKGRSESRKISANTVATVNAYGLTKCMDHIALRTKAMNSALAGAHQDDEQCRGGRYYGQVAPYR